MAHRFIVDTLAGATSLPTEVTDALLSDLLTIGIAKQPAITVLEGIKAQPVTSAGVWKGYLIPPTDEAYVFVAIGETQPPPLLLDGESIPFKYQQEDPSNVWSTDPTAKKLKKGKLYWLEVSGQSPSQIQWKTTTLSKTSIPTSALLPDYSKGSETEVFTKLSKAALLVNGFNLSVDEVTYWQTHAVNFDGFDINAVTLKHWLRLQAYTRLRNSLPKAETNLLDLFEWAAKPVDAAKQPAKIAALSQLYVLAAHIYGPRGQKIPKRGKVQPQTYNSLLDKWDAFGNAMVELELAFPFSNQTPLLTGISNGVVGLANVFGFATTLYFCIPDNPQLRALRDTIDDRLFKIRHCQNIEGVFRKLPLFEPPIDPGLLVQAAAQGLSLASVLNDLNSFWGDKQMEKQ